MAESTYTAMAVGDGYPVPPLPNPGEGGPVPDFDFPPEPGPGPELDNGNVITIPAALPEVSLDRLLPLFPAPLFHATSAILPSMALSAS